MIALCLGGARSVWDDLAAAQALLGSAEFKVVAANHAGITYPGRLDGWATVHHEMMGPWEQQRAAQGLNTDYRVFHPPSPPEAWPATSGFYAAQVAITRLHCGGVILCGIPLDAEAGHIHWPGDWNAHHRYRAGAQKAHRVARQNIRSMSGWTRQLFGPPDGEWLARNSGL